MNNNIIPIDSVLKDFKKYLNLNNRCIFSARFGDGKSYFLSKFANKYQKQYLFVPIYPVNYQIAENKDIFEYIKRDILIRLLASGEIEINDTVISNSIYLYYYLLQNKIDISSNILDVVPDINLNGTDISLSALSLAIKAFNKVKSKFDEYKSKFKNEEEEIKNFIESYENEKGSIYEFDIISQLICDLISQYRTKYKNRRKVVLLIEDLDRIDPVHIFRILNIFSAHFDRYNISYTELIKTQGYNKFNFDKIITVCHYENVKSIYHHFYGENTDFMGYICKFSFALPFHYSLIDKLHDYILSLFNNMLLQNHLQLCEVITKLIIDKYLALNDNLHGNIRFIIHSMKQPPSVSVKNIDVIDNLKISSYNCLTISLDLLQRFDLSISDIIKKLKEEKLEVDLIGALIGECWLIVSVFLESVQFSLEEAILYCTVPKGQNSYQRVRFKIDITRKGDLINHLEYRDIQRASEGSAITNQRQEILSYFNSYLINSNSKTIQ